LNVSINLENINTKPKNVMRKTTVNLIVGILIGMLISGVSDSVSTDTATPTNVPVATTISSPISVDLPDPFDQQIAPGLQIIEVPPPLNLMGSHPYQCYMNGEPINIPKELVKQLVAKHGNPTDNDPNFNVHNFTGNLKMIDLPVGSTIPTSPLGANGRIR
jgi:hypothetical protein